MNNAIETKIAEPLKGHDVPIFLIKEETDFSVTEYKMMESFKSLISCRKAYLNGTLQLVFLKGGFVPLNVLKLQMTEENIIHVIEDICDTLTEIENNGFMRSGNVVFSENYIFINPSDWSAYLIYLPIVNKETSMSLTTHEINAFFLSLIEDSEYVTPQTVHSIENYSIKNPEASIVDLKNYYRGLIRLIKERNSSETTMQKRETVLFLRADDAGKETVFRINQPIFTIGRKKSAVDGLLSNNPSLGRVHCKITKENGYFFVTDLGSVNGTFVNNKKLTAGKSVEIHTNDILSLSNTKLTVEIREE